MDFAFLIIIFGFVLVMLGDGVGRMSSRSINQYGGAFCVVVLGKNTKNNALKYLAGL